MKGGESMKKLIVGLLVAILIVGGIGVFIIMTKAPAQARPLEYSINCSWGEIKDCYGGGCNACCPENCKP